MRAFESLVRVVMSVMGWFCGKVSNLVIKAKEIFFKKMYMGRCKDVV